MRNCLRWPLLALALTVVFSTTPAFGQQIDLAGMWSASLGNHEELPLREIQA